MYINISSFLILFILFSEKYLTIIWLKKKGHLFRDYEIEKRYFYVNRFINYTTVASYLAVI